MMMMENCRSVDKFDCSKNIINVMSLSNKVGTAEFKLELSHAVAWSCKFV